MPQRRSALCNRCGRQVAFRSSLSRPFRKWFVCLRDANVPGIILGLRSSFAERCAPCCAECDEGALASFPLRFLPRLSGKTRSVFWIDCVSVSLVLAGKVSHREAVSLDGPPTFRRPLRPGLYRHHLISFVRVVIGHFPFVFGSSCERGEMSVSSIPSV
jgi:hypothetical protein